MLTLGKKLAKTRVVVEGDMATVKERLVTIQLLMKLDHQAVNLEFISFYNQCFTFESNPY